MQCSPIAPIEYKQHFQDSLKHGEMENQACRIMVIIAAIFTALSSFLFFDPVIALTAFPFLFLGALILSVGGSDVDTVVVSHAPRPWYSYVFAWRWSPTVIDVRPRVHVGTRVHHRHPTHRGPPLGVRMPRPSAPPMSFDPRPRVQVGGGHVRPTAPNIRTPIPTQNRPVSRAAPRVPVGRRR